MKHERIAIVSFPRSGTKVIQHAIAMALPLKQLKVEGESSLAEVLNAGIHCHRSYPIMAMTPTRHYVDNTGLGCFDSGKLPPDRYGVRYEREGSGNVFRAVRTTSIEQYVPVWKVEAILDSIRPQDSFVMKVFPSLLSEEALFKVAAWAAAENVKLVGVIRRDLSGLARSFFHAFASGDVISRRREPVEVPSIAYPALFEGFETFLTALRILRMDVIETSDISYWSEIHNNILINRIPETKGLTLKQLFLNHAEVLSNMRNFSRKFRSDVDQLLSE